MAAREIRNFSSSVEKYTIIYLQAEIYYSRAVTAKKCTKKAWCTCRVVVLPIQPIALPTDRAPPNPFIR